MATVGGNYVRLDTLGLTPYWLEIADLRGASVVASSASHVTLFTQTGRRIELVDYTVKGWQDWWWGGNFEVRE